MERRLAAILAADVVGYSRLMGEDEAGTYTALKVLREQLIAPCITAHEGRIIKLMGDGLLAEFASAVQAVSSAAAIQRALAERNVDPPGGRSIRIRIGVNVGDVIVEGDDLYGDGVNIAARLEGIADPGGIYLSRNVYEQVRNKVDLDFRDLGRREMKNIAEPVHVFAALLGGEKRVVSAPAGRRRRFSPALLIGAAAAGLLVVAAGIAASLLPLRSGIEPASVARMALPLPERPSIAVLPFTNTSGEADQEYFADGITDDLTTDLSKVPGLFVISRHSAFTYKGKAVKVGAVAEELGVRYVLEGSVRRGGDQVRINVRLVDALDGKMLWAERYDRRLTDILKLQDDITARIAGALRVRLTSGGEPASEWHQTTSAEAYDRVLRARKLLTRFRRQDADAAREVLERAIALDRGYARAYGLLAHYYLDLWRLWGEGRDRNLAQAENDAATAAKLDPRDPSPHVTLAQVHLFRREFEKAGAEADAALALAPRDAAALANLGSMLRYIRRSAEAAEFLERAIRLDPFHPANYLEWLGDAYFLLGRFEACAEAVERGIALEANFVALHVIAAKCYAALGDEERAGAAVAEILRINPRFTVTAFASYVPFSDADDLRRNVEMLRKAGAPE